MTTRPPIIIPPALKPLTTQKRWVVWRWVSGKNGKPTKPPFRADAPRKHASSTDSATWNTIDVAMLAYEEGKCDGIGFVLTDSSFSAFDVDHCRNASTGIIHPYAHELVLQCGSYAEVTPSGEGIRIIGLGNGPPLHRKFNVPDTDGLSVEIYRKAERYITVTGLQIDDAIRAMAELDAVAETVAADLDSAKQEKPATNGAGGDKQTKSTKGTKSGAGQQRGRDKQRGEGKKLDLEELIRNGEGGHFGGDRSRAVWFVIHGLLKLGKSADEIVAVLIDPANGISAHCLDQSDPAQYARRQVEKAEKEQAADPDVEITRLAKLSALDYDQQRKAAAEKLGIRTGILDRLVKAERTELGLDADDGKQGRAVAFPEPEPWPEPVDGAAMLTDMAKAIGSHVVMGEASRDIAALWAVHTYLLDCFWITPRLAVRSATWRCGKSTLLYTLKRLVYRPQSAESVTAAAMFRLNESHRPTWLVDEADTFLNNNESLRNIFDSGYERDGCAVLTVVAGDNHESLVFSTYAALAIALIGKLPGTVHDRSVVIDLKRRLRSETIVPLRKNRAGHLDELARKAVRWSKDHAEQIGDAEPTMPPEIFSRDADKWHALFAIADAAGGEWPERARKAAVECLNAADDDDASRLETLLGDIQSAFADKGTKVQDLLGAERVELTSADAVEVLIGIEGHPWAEMGKNRKPLSKNGLARMLRPLGIRPGKVGPETKRVSGYKLHQFEEAFARYLAHGGQPNRTAGQPPTRSNTYANSQPDSQDPGCPVANSGNPLNSLETVRMSGCGDPSEGKPRVRTARSESDDLPAQGPEDFYEQHSDSNFAYHGPVVEVPDLGEDPLDEYGTPIKTGHEPEEHPTEAAAPTKAGRVGEEVAPPVAGVPFMITKEMRRRLRILGYAEGHIDALTPQQALDILNKL